MASQIWGEFPPPNPKNGGGGNARFPPKSPIPLKVPPIGLNFAEKWGEFPPQTQKNGGGGNARFPPPQITNFGGGGKKALAVGTLHALTTYDMFMRIVQTTVERQFFNPVSWIFRAPSNKVQLRSNSASANGPSGANLAIYARSFCQIDPKMTHIFQICSKCPNFGPPLDKTGIRMAGGGASLPFSPAKWLA